MKKILGKVLLFSIGVVIVLHITGATDRSSQNAHVSGSTVHQDARVEYRTKTVTAPISQDCKDEMRLSVAYAEAARNLGHELAGESLIQDESFEAIVDKDWAALNEAKQHQIDLDEKADPWKLKVVELAGQLAKVKGACKKQLGD